MKAKCKYFRNILGG
ncbi:hypothetical protein LINGRAPRIM_LOCUS2889 [Linum grandiflorum]